MNNLVALPILIPLLTASIAMVGWRSRIFQRVVALVGAALLLGCSLALLYQSSTEGIQVLQMGAWIAPFGISLVADLLSSIMVVITGLMGLSVLIYSLASNNPEYENFGYYPLMHVLFMGVNGAFLTGDIFNMYVWFEVMLISSFVLLSMGRKRSQMEGAIKYVTLNFLSSGIFLAGIGIIYGVTGTLNMADLSVKLADADPNLTILLSVLFLIAFGIKSGVFPLFFWLPASYHTPPIAVTAIFASLLTKVGVYSLIRVFTLIFIAEPEFTHHLLLFIAGMTMLTGVLGAAAHYEIRRILSFHIISQIGYIVMGLGLFTPLGLAGSVFFLVHNIIVKTNLFLVGGVINRLRGSYHLKKLGGLYELNPMLGILFLIPAFSIAGIPPLSGFWAKLMLIKGGLDIEAYVVVGVALVVSILTLYSMTKIWDQAFWKPEPDTSPARPDKPSAFELSLWLAPVILLAVITVVMGLFPAVFFDIAMRAGEQLMNPAEYIEAVLGQTP